MAKYGKKPNRQEPQEKYRRSQKHTFVNPYSFVSTLAEENETNRESVEKYYGSQVLHTGVLHCGMITQTPLAIPDVEKKFHEQTDPKEHYSYPFYRIDDKITVPGSTIRGMIRSLYETATDSCFVTMRENEVITARVGARDAYNPGILERIAESNGSDKEKWVLYPAEDYLIDLKDGQYRVKVKGGCRVLCYVENGTEKVIENGSPVTLIQTKKNNRNQTVVDDVCLTVKPKEGHQDYLFIGEPFGNKKTHERVFHCNRNKYMNVSEADINTLENIVFIYQNPSINRNLNENGNTGYASFEKCKERGLIPVWYKGGGKNLSLSTAAIGRKAYRHTVNDLAGKKHNPCTSRLGLCPACMLFGMANGEAYGGRVRFSDASTDYKPEKISYVTLQELGTPRTGYLPFYSLDGLDYDASGANIAGRKYYWHISKAKDDPNVYIVRKTDSGEQKTERNASMELVPAEIEFGFDVYYEKITDQQLQELKWVLSLGENTTDSSLMQKLGHGKPLGLGSVKILIQTDSRRKFSLEKGYSIQASEVENTIDVTERIQSSIKEQIRIISDFHIMDKQDIRYPYVEKAANLEYDKNRKLKDNVLASHQWFTLNKDRTKGEVLLLPGITEDKHTLAVYELVSVTEKDYEDEKRGNTNKGKSYNSGQKSSGKKPDMNLPTITGKIKFYKQEEDYGYIVGDDGREYYFRRNNFPGLIVNKTRNKEAVSFKIRKWVEGKKEKYSVIQIKYI